MRTASRAISFIFHPLFVLTYILLIYLFMNPYMFGYAHLPEADLLILMVFLLSACIPLVAIAVMRGLGWIKSLEMYSKQERIGPYIVTGIIYLSLYMPMTQGNVYPLAFQSATLGAIIGLFSGFFVNNFEKVSIHALAMGGLAAATVLFAVYFAPDRIDTSWMGLGFSRIESLCIVYSVLLIAGVVCTARLLLNRHSPRNIYVGLILGIISQLIGFQILI